MPLALYNSIYKSGFPRKFNSVILVINIIFIYFFKFKYFQEKVFPVSHEVSVEKKLLVEME